MPNLNPNAVTAALKKIESTYCYDNTMTKEGAFMTNNVKSRPPKLVTRTLKFVVHGKTEQTRTDSIYRVMRKILTVPESGRSETLKTVKSTNGERQDTNTAIVIYAKLHKDLDNGPDK